MQVATQTSLAKSWAEAMTDDANLQKAIINAATVLGKEAGKLATATKSLLANPASPEAKVKPPIPSFTLLRNKQCASSIYSVALDI